MFQVRQKSTPSSVSGESDILMSSRLVAFGTCIPLLRCKSVEPKKSKCLPTSFPSSLIRRNELVQTEFLGPFMSREPLVRPWSKERLSIIVNLLSSEWHNLNNVDLSQMYSPSPSIMVASSFGPPGQLGSWSPFKGRFKDQFERKGTADPRHWVSWLYWAVRYSQSTSFKILVKLRLGFVWQREIQL